MRLLKLCNVSFTYKQNTAPKVEALIDINLTISPGERWVIIGPSGSGKSTLMLLMAGLIAPTAGRILYHNRLLAGPQPGVSLILQEYGLFPWKNVLENASLGLILKGDSKDTVSHKVLPLLDSLGIQDKIDNYPAQLSGGQRQRVAIARALATEPELLLMDEPFSALDALTREQLQSTLLHLWKDLCFTMVLVTHNIEEAVFLGNRIVLLSPSPGYITHIIDNGHREGLMRDSSEFYHQCSLVRSLLEGGV